jgi:hypothetical protein
MAAAQCLDASQECETFYIGDEAEDCHSHNCMPASDADTASTTCADESLCESADELPSTDEEDLAAVEARLTRGVPLLLERINECSDNVNSLELQLGQARRQHQESCTSFAERYVEAKRSHGDLLCSTGAFFAAERSHRGAARRVERASRRYALAATGELSSQAMLARACQHFRQEHAEAVKACVVAKSTMQCYEAQSNKDAVALARPVMAQLQREQQAAALCGRMVAGLHNQLMVAKASYKQTMVELERISFAVHNARNLLAA